MDKKLTHCADCDKKFKEKDEVATTNASGDKAVVHIDCLEGWLLRWSDQNYFDTYEDFLIETDGKL